MAACQAAAGRVEKGRGASCSAPAADGACRACGQLLPRAASPTPCLPALATQVYEDPSIVDRACRSSLLVDLAWLAFYGFILRLGTYLVLVFKVEQRMTSASIFG
jgi:hypothetical protein